jgi:N-methylhydantoinase A
MMRAISDITVNEGVNPRESTIVAGGGAAGLNIMMIAKELGCARVLLPKVASALSASGMQYANIVSEEAASLVTLSNRFEREKVNALLDGLTARLQKFRRGLGDRGDDYVIEYFAEARYLAQVWELDTPIARGKFRNDEDVSALVDSFHQVHERVFAVRDEGSPVEIVNWKARLTAKINRSTPTAAPAAANNSATPTSKRNCFFGSSSPVVTAIFKAADIQPGALIEGPAIIEEPTTTVVIYPGMNARVSGAGNYLLNVA